jgi:hypothetical protein
MGDVQLIKVTMDDRAYDVWAAATSGEEAVSRILDAVPEGWSASLLDIRLTAMEREQLKLEAGEVRKLR